MSGLLVLQIEKGPQAGERIWLRDGQTIRVGSTEYADFSIGDPHMSGVHFLVEARRDGCRIRDLSSQTGTLLNSSAVTSDWLNDGDRVLAGNTEFIVRIQGMATRFREHPPRAPSIQTTDRVKQQLTIGCVYRRTQSGIYYYRPERADASVSIVADHVRSKTNLYFAVNPTALRTDSIIGLAALANGPEVAPNLRVVDTSTAPDWQDLLKYLWGKNATLLLLSSHPVDELCHNLSSLATFYSMPQLLQQHIETGHPDFARRIVHGLNGLIAESENGESWHVYSCLAPGEQIATLGLAAESDGTHEDSQTSLADRHATAP